MDDDVKQLGPGERLAANVAIGVALRAIGSPIGVRIVPARSGPELVIPPDLEPVPAAAVDAEGRVTCLYCGAPTLQAHAELVGTAGYGCRPCLARAYQNVAPIESADLRPRGRGAMLAAIAVVVLAVIALLLFKA